MSSRPGVKTAAPVQDLTARPDRGVAGDVDPNAPFAGSGPREVVKQSWLQLAASPSIVRRSLILCVIVGSVLTIINHGDLLMAGQMTGRQWFKVGLTYCVPYIVSTLSSVGALRAAQNANFSPK